MNSRDKLSFEYRDDASTFFLWWKTLFLLPLWSIPIVVLFGFFYSATDTNLGVFAFFLTLILGILYFFHDFRKQFLRINGNSLWCGIRQFDLNNIVSIEIVQSQLSPIARFQFMSILPPSDTLQLCFEDGKKLNLQASRFKSGECSNFIQYLESKYPNCKIECKATNALKNRDTKEFEQLIVRISPHLFLEQMRGAFASAQKLWTENSFLLVFFFASPAWMLITFYCIFAFSFRGENMRGLYDALSMIGISFSKAIYDIGFVGIAQICTLSKESILGFVSFLVLLVVAIKFARLFLSTQCLQLTDKGILLKHEFSGIEYFSTVRLLWEDVKTVQVDANILHLTGIHESQDISVDLSSLNATKKAELFAYLTKHVQHCQQIKMDSATQESLMPKQNLSYTELWLQSLTQSPTPQALIPLEQGRKLKENTYTVEKALGAGGQGTAYLCSKSGIQPENVVLKEIIFPVFVDNSIRKQSLERFEKDATTLQKLSHKNIVKLTDYFIEDHRGYLTLEYIEGKDLRSLIEENRLSEAEIIHILREVLSALSYLHEQGILHRDLSPENLLRTTDGQIKLIDFDVARKSDAGVTATIVGKHAYISPEQFRGKPNTQSDIYSLGATLFYLATGADPEPISQSSLCDGDTGYGTMLDAIIQKCTELDLSKRFQNVSEIEDWLSNLEGEVIKFSVKEKTVEVKA